MSIKNELTLLFEEYAKTSEYELVDISYKKEGPNKVLRITIDKESSSIGLDDCVNVSKGFGKLLDEKDIISESYSLEVSSPGLDRPLVKLRDFDRFKGNKIIVRLKSPIKEIHPTKFSYEGDLLGIREDVILLKTEENELEIPYSMIKKSNIIYEF